jgi:4-hydroxyphenylacetate 3-monooxygenase
VCDQAATVERVFLHNDASMSRRIYIETPANCYQNHQSNIRFNKDGSSSAPRVALPANGTDKICGARDVGMAGVPGGVDYGLSRARSKRRKRPEGYATPNRRIMYAALNWCQEHYTEIVDTLRTLLGGYPLVMPASIDVVTDPALRDRFERWWKTPAIEAAERHKLYKLAWDIVGSEFAGRHMLYEKFYAGSSIVVRNQSDREAPWEKFHATVDDCSMASSCRGRAKVSARRRPPRSSAIE